MIIRAIQQPVWQSAVIEMSREPDRIILYREPLLSICSTEQQLRDQVHVTLVHEIAHFFGIDDAELHELGWG